MEYPWQLKEISHLPKFQTGKHSNYTNDILGLLSYEDNRNFMVWFVKTENILVGNSTSTFFKIFNWFYNFKVIDF